MEKFKVIAIYGLARSGKDTFANFLLSKIPSHKDLFSYDLKYIATTYIGWSGDWEGDKSPKDREMLQLLGTEVGRNYHPDIWNAKIAERNNFSHDIHLPEHNLDDPFNDKMMMLENIYSRLNKKNRSFIKASLIALVELGWDGIECEKSRELITNLQKLALNFNPKFWNQEINKDFFAQRLQEIYEAKKRRFRKVLLISDMRFNEEYQLVKAQKDSLLVHIKRPLKKMNHRSEGALDYHYFDIVIDNSDNFYHFLNRKDFSIFDNISDDDLKECPNNSKDILLYFGSKYPHDDWNKETVIKEIERASQASLKHLFDKFERVYQYIDQELTKEDIDMARKKQEPLKWKKKIK